MCVSVQSLSHVQLCDPMDCRVPNSFVHGIPPENIGVACHFLLQCVFLPRESYQPILGLLHWQAESLPMHHLENETMQKKKNCEVGLLYFSLLITLFFPFIRERNDWE